LWQTVERKAKFINQLMRGRLDVREIEDIGDTALSYAEVKALASGDSRIMALAKAETDATKLERLERAWTSAQRSLAATVREAGPRLKRLAVDREQLVAAMPLRRDTEGDTFSITIAGSSFSKRADAAPALKQALMAIPPYLREQVPLGKVGGLHLQVRADPWMGQTRYVVSLVEVPRVQLVLEPSDVRQPSLGLVTKIENLPRRLERVLDDVDVDTGRLNREADKARDGLLDTFPRKAELEEVRTRRDRLAAELAADTAKKTGDRQAGGQVAAAQSPNGSQPVQGNRPAISPPGLQLAVPSPTGAPIPVSPGRSR
jgi:hypothetical protein